MFVEANPQYKTLNLYDSNMQKQFQGIERNDVKRGEEKAKEAEKSKEKKEG